MLLIAIMLSPLLGHSQGDFQKNYQKGTEYFSRGIYDKAAYCFKNAEKNATRNYEKNRALKGLADSYKAVSDNIHALACYERLLPLYQGENLNVILLNMSDLWNQTGQFAKTIEKLEPMTTKYDDFRLNNLSIAYLRTGQQQKSIEMFGTVISKNDPATIAGATQNKGYALWSSGKNDEAAECLKTAFDKFPDGKAGKYVCLGNLAKVNSALGRHDEALQQIDNAIQWQRLNLGEGNADYIISVRKKAEILMEKGDTTAAAKQFKQYFELSRDYIAKNFAYMSENERINSWHTQKPLLDECFATEYADPDFLFDVAVFSKSVLVQANRNFAKTVSSDRKLSPIYDSLMSTRNIMRTATPDERQKLSTVADALEKQLVDNMPKLGSFVDDLKKSGKDIRNALKDENDMAIEIVYYPKAGKMHYAALVMRKRDPVKFVPLFTSSEIENFKIGGGFYNVQECINEQRRANFKYALYNDTALAKLVWGKLIADAPKRSNVYFVPDGIYHSLAVEYMPNGRADLRIFRLSASRSLCEPTASKPLKNFLLVGGLRYDDTTSVRAYRDTTPNRLGSEVYGRWSNWQDLPNSAIEIDTVRKILGTGDNSVITGDRGTEDRIKQLLGQYQAALFSTHGYFRMNKSLRVINQYSLADNITEDQSMSLCGLVLSGVNITAQRDSLHSKMEDGLLTALEISELDLSQLDLVVLSACQTNLGRITQDGVFNLPRGLKKAGAKSLLVSLWEVNDEATQKLMTAFFNNIKKGMSKYDAIHDAQAQLRNASEFANPYYWAPFVLIDGI